MIYFVLAACVLAVQGAELQIKGDANDESKVEFGGALTLSHNAAGDELVCSGKIKAADVLVEGTSTTVADLIGEVATIRQEMEAMKAFVGMMPPPASPPPGIPPPPPPAFEFCEPVALSWRYDSVSASTFIDLPGVTYGQGAMTVGECLEACSASTACKQVVVQSAQTLEGLDLNDARNLSAAGCYPMSQATSSDPLGGTNHMFASMACNVP